MTLHVVTDDPKVPSPVTFERIGQAVETMGTSFEVFAEEGFGLANFSGFPFQFAFTTSGKFLSVRILWKTDLPMSTQAMAALFTAADQWNRERYFPTIYTLVSDDMIEVCADYICSVDAGMNEEQLVDNISAGVASGMDGINFMQSIAKGVATQLAN